MIAFVYVCVCFSLWGSVCLLLHFALIGCKRSQYDHLEFLVYVQTQIVYFHIDVDIVGRVSVEGFATVCRCYGHICVRQQLTSILI
jgi:hypothetical protein